MTASTSRRRFLTAAGLGTAGVITTGLAGGVASAQTDTGADSASEPTEADMGSAPT